MTQPEVAVPWFNASSNDGSSCVDVQQLTDGTIQMRNSTRPDGAVIDYTPAEFRAFVLGAKDGKFDHVL
jgi:transposase InsO family protein